MVGEEAEEDKAELRGVLLLQTAVYKLVVLGVKPLVVCRCEMGKRPKRIDSHKAVVVKHKLIKQFL